jgi:hypothetical protein
MGQPPHRRLQLNLSQPLNTRSTITASTTPITAILIIPGLSVRLSLDAGYVAGGWLASPPYTPFVFFRSPKVS